LRSVLVSTLTLVALVAASQVLQVSAKQLKILEFDTVVSLPPAFTAGQNPGPQRERLRTALDDWFRPG
jgi:hypothetical protein